MSKTVPWCTLGAVSTEAPSPRPYGVSDEEAIQLCRDWMVFLGATDTVAASGPVSEVCNLYSSMYVGWVDNRRGNIDADVVQRAANVAAGDGRRPVVFVSGGMRPIAQDLAEALGVALLRYRSQDGALDGVNSFGRHLRAAGMATK